MKTKLTPDEMVAAIESCRPLAFQLAKRYHFTNPGVRLRELNAAAIYGLKLAALKFDPSRGVKFITPAHRFIRSELWAFCLTEAAHGMHVPDGHKPYHAPAPLGIHETFYHPGASDPPFNGLGEDFWALVVRDLSARDGEIVLRIFRDGKQQPEVAAELGISKQRVGQLLQRAMTRLQRRDDLWALVEEVEA